MRHPTLLAPVLLAACAAAPTVQPPADSIDWLAGCWRLDRPDGYYEEVWLPPSADGTLGVSREVRGGKTVSYEHLRLERRDGGVLAYVAKPSRQAQAEFLAAAPAPGRFTFENPQHDFPRTIEYRWLGPDAITVTLSGPSKAGGTRSFDYPLQRATCQD